jgi:hypothetical protein
MAAARLKAQDWASLNGFIIRDADGFRLNDGVDIESLLTYSEWRPRAMQATIQVTDRELFQRYLEA